MPRNPKGELTLGEIRNLVRQHNKLSVIQGVDSKSRDSLIKEITKKGYSIDHAGKKIVKGRSIIRNPGKKVVRGEVEIKLGKEGEQKPQKRTIRKALIKGGEKPVMTQKKKPPPIPKNVKGKRVKPDRSKLIKEGDKPVLAKKGRGRPKGSKNKSKY